MELDPKLGDRLFFDQLASIRYLIRDGKLGLITNEMIKNKLKPLFYDIESHFEQHRYRNYALSKEPLYKAIGLKKGLNLKVVDATFGEGKDAMLLVHFGAKVTSFERNPYLAPLILSDLKNMNNPKLNESFRFIYGDSRTISPEGDVLYYDPMYAHSANTKAKPRKEIQVFREIVGNDTDNQEFLKWALSKYSRVVVKRPLKGDYLMDGASHSFKGKSTRYDVYLKD